MMDDTENPDPDSAPIPDSGGNVRLDEVARAAGVSTATVSRVLNASSPVAEHTRERVLDAVRSLGYVPHGAARALASRRSNTMGAVIPTVDNAIFAHSVQALQNRLFESDFALLLAISDYNFERERREVQALLGHGIDGLILVGSEHHPQVYGLIRQKTLPYVNIWTYDPDKEHPCIGFDNAEAAYRVATYLLDIGHRHIAMVAGITEGNDRAMGRVRGVRQALSERGLDFPAGQLVERPYEVSAGRRAAGSLLASPTPPTAIVCGNDILALGVLFECLARGYEVPRSMSITGFDGIDLAGQVDPPLTTMTIPSATMGSHAADYLLARLMNRPVPDKTPLEANLVVRGTTAPPRIRNPGSRT